MEQTDINELHTYMKAHVERVQKLFDSNLDPDFKENVKKSINDYLEKLKEVRSIHGGEVSDFGFYKGNIVTPSVNKQPHILVLHFGSDIQPKMLTQTRKYRMSWRRAKPKIAAYIVDHMRSMLYNIKFNPVNSAKSVTFTVNTSKEQP